MKKSPGPGGLLRVFHLLRLPPPQGPVKTVLEKKRKTHSASIRYRWGTVWFIRSKEPGLKSKAGKLPTHSRLEPQDPVELMVRSSHVAPRDPWLPPGLQPSFLLSSGRVPQGHPWWNPSPAVRWKTVLRQQDAVCGTCFTSWETEPRLRTTTFATSDKTTGNSNHN